MIKNKIALIISIMIFVFTIYYINGVFIMKRTDGITTMQDFYAQDKDTIDVLILGSSHAGMNLDAAELWDEYGIASYALWGSVQPFWNTYYFLKEALKTQSPQVVLLEVNGAMFNQEYSDEARQVTNTAGMHLNMNKVMAIKETTPKEQQMDLLLGLPIYHSRYSELAEDDFYHFVWNRDILKVNKGTSQRYGEGDISLLDVSNISERREIYPKSEKYFRLIIETCIEKKIPIVLFKTPTSMRDEVQTYMNSVQDIADEYGIDFINFNIMDAETGFTQKGYWMDGHLNTYGARCISSWLGKYLVENYSIPDRRGDEKYQSWNAFSKKVNKEYLNAIEEPKDYFCEVKKNKYSILMLKDGRWGQMESVSDFFSEVGISNNLQIAEESGLWLLSSDDLQVIEQIPIVEGENQLTICGEQININLGDMVEIIYNGEKVYETGQRGIVFIIFDKKSNEFIEAVNLYHYEGFQKVNHKY